MTDLTPNTVARTLMDLARDLDALADLYRDQEQRAAEAKRDAEVAYSRAYMQAEGSVEDRKQRAISETSELRFTADLADRVVRSTRVAIDAKKVRIEVGRTLASNLRAEMSLAGVG